MPFEVRNKEIEELLRDLGRQIKQLMPEGFGFTLLIYTYDKGALFYLSSAEREDMIESMKEFIRRQTQ
jgi:hypothetical protein